MLFAFHATVIDTNDIVGGDALIEPIVMEEPEPRLPQVDLPIEPDSAADASSESADTEDSGADPDRELAEVVRLPTAPR